MTSEVSPICNFFFFFGVYSLFDRVGDTRKAFLFGRVPKMESTWNGNQNIFKKMLLRMYSRWNGMMAVYMNIHVMYMTVICFGFFSDTYW